MKLIVKETRVGNTVVRIDDSCVSRDIINILKRLEQIAARDTAARVIEKKGA